VNVGLALEIDSSIDAMATIVTALDDTLKEFFKEKSYGSDVENLAIGIILTSPDIDRMHAKRDLKYRKRVSYRTPKMEFANVVEYDVKPSCKIRERPMGVLEQEKLKIYSYFLIDGSLPPGNKIFR
jgi:hypothetical protein